MLGRGDGVASRSIHDDNAVSGGGGNIDVVHADAGATDDLQAAGFLQNLFGHLGSAADGQPIESVNNFRQRLRAAGGFLIVDHHLDLTGCFQDFLCKGGHAVSNHHFVHASRSMIF